MIELWLLMIQTQAGLASWVIPALSGLVGGALAAGTTYGMARGTLESHERRLSELEDKELEEKFVTRREFEQTMKYLRNDLNTLQNAQGEMQADLRTIRDHILTEGQSDLP